MTLLAVFVLLTVLDFWVILNKRKAKNEKRKENAKRRIEARLKQCPKTGGSSKSQERARSIPLLSCGSPPDPTRPVAASTTTTELELTSSPRCSLLPSETQLLCDAEELAPNEGRSIRGLAPHAASSSDEVQYVGEDAEPEDDGEHEPFMLARRSDTQVFADAARTGDYSRILRHKGGHLSVMRM